MKDTIVINGVKYPYRITRQRDGWVWFHIYTKGSPVAEHSVPTWMMGGGGCFTTGSHYSNMTNRNNQRAI